MAQTERLIRIEVIYATLDCQQPILLTLPLGSMMTAAIEQSKITERYPDILANPLVVGIFGEIIHDPDRYPLQDGDRVEIYRPLLIDPKEARRNRAGKKD